MRKNEILYYFLINFTSLSLFLMFSIVCYYDFGSKVKKLIDPFTLAYINKTKYKSESK